MVVVLEAAGLAFLLAIVWVLFRFAASRPEDRGALMAARLALGAWAVFAASVLIDFRAIARDPLGTLANIAIAAAVIAVILGYRRVLGAVRNRADRR